MHNVRIVLFAVTATALVMACSLTGVPVQQVDNVSTIVASTVNALTPVAPLATATGAPAATQASQATAAPQGIPVSYKNVSFVIPSGLASDAAPSTVPVTTEANGAPWDAAPEHIHFTFDGYNVPANNFEITQLDVYPAKDYADANAGANISLQRLHAVLASPSAQLTNETLPQVPNFNAASMFSARIQRIHFQSGDGVRSITMYGQAFGPVTNNGTFYHFEGLTADGQYYLVAVLPIQSDFLANGNDPSAPLPAGGIPFPGYSSMDPKYYDQYFQAVTDKLNSADPGTFHPSVEALDAMMQSITIQP